MRQSAKSNRRKLRHLLGLIALIVPLYAINAQWGTQANPDVIAANVASWQIANEGTLDVSEYEIISENLEEFDRWFVELPDGRVVSNRPPGLVALGVPAYAAVRSESFTVAPGTAIAVLTTTLAILIIWNVLIGLVGPDKATWSALVIALGTPTWWISSAQLWPHGPGQLWAALAVAALAASSHMGAGWAFAASVTTRPVTAISAAVTGVYESYQQRSWLPVLKIGAISGLGAACVLAYNRIVFGMWSIVGGYSPNFTTGAMESFDAVSYLANVFDMFLGLPHGVLVVTPIVGVATIGAFLARKSIPGWAISTALAGLGYLLVHAALNRASGGLGIFYRYPLEAIILAAPALAIGANRIWHATRLGRRIVFGAAAISIFLQVLYVTYLVCFFDPGAPLCLARGA